VCVCVLFVLYCLGRHERWCLSVWSPLCALEPYTTIDTGRHVERYFKIVCWVHESAVGGLAGRQALRNRSMGGLSGIFCFARAKVVGLEDMRCIRCRRARVSNTVTSYRLTTGSRMTCSGWWVVLRVCLVCNEARDDCDCNKRRLETRPHTHTHTHQSCAPRGHSKHSSSRIHTWRPTRPRLLRHLVARGVLCFVPWCV
jgi:hypothetical protein